MKKRVKGLAGGPLAGSRALVVGSAWRMSSCLSIRASDRITTLIRISAPKVAGVGLKDSNCGLSVCASNGKLSAMISLPRCLFAHARLAALLCAAGLCAAAPVAHAQYSLPTPTPAAVSPAGPGAGISFGSSLNGTLSDSAPRQVYVFEGLRGDLVSVNLDVTRGDLLPSLLLVDGAGQVLALRDGEANAGIRGIRLPETDVYSLVVSRFGGETGTTRGDYTLALDRTGASASSGGALRYGDSVIAQISDAEPQLYYLFRGQRGDILSASMQRIAGDLDPRLQVVNAEGRVIAENDEIAGSGSLDARVDAFVLQEDGMYVLIASRFGGEAGPSAGSFVLTLGRGADSGLGGTALMAIPLQDGVAHDGQVTAERYAEFYQFSGHKDEVVTLNMERVAGSGLDPFLVLTDGLLTELVADDDGAGQQNSQIKQFVLPADGIYYIIATRYQRESGTSAGPYRLTLTREGDAFAGALPAVPRLDYGNATIGMITDETPEVLFAFIGSAGDTITASMLRSDGNLDSLLTLLDQDQNELAQDDDSAGSQNARIERFTLPYTGVYYLRASRYTNPAGGTPTAGSFLITLAQRFDTR